MSRKSAPDIRTVYSNLIPLPFSLYDSMSLLSKTSDGLWR